MGPVVARPRHVRDELALVKELTERASHHIIQDALLHVHTHSLRPREVDTETEKR
jgi:hypothetical protein